MGAVFRRGLRRSKRRSVAGRAQFRGWQSAASARWRGVNSTPDGLRLLHNLRRCLLEPPAQIHPGTPATDSAAENVRATA